MKRLTRHIDKYPCRIKDCSAENWIEDVTGVSFYDWNSDESLCANCPFEEYMNRLAELEDEFERYEDDGK